MDELGRLLEVTARWARRCGLSEDDVQRAQTDAWYYWAHRTADHPPGVWARWAVRHVRAGRDLPGCATRSRDALHLAVEDGDGVGVVIDNTPPPDVLASHREEWTLLMGNLTPTHRQVASLKVQGVEGRRIAQTLGLSPARVSQIAREITEGWGG